MKTLQSLAVVSVLALGGAVQADCCKPAPTCEPPCPAMVTTECVPMVRVDGPCCTTQCCPEKPGIFGMYILNSWL